MQTEFVSPYCKAQFQAKCKKARVVSEVGAGLGIRSGWYWRRPQGSFGAKRASPNEPCAGQPRQGGSKEFASEAGHKHAPHCCGNTKSSKAWSPRVGNIVKHRRRPAVPEREDRVKRSQRDVEWMRTPGRQSSSQQFSFNPPPPFRPNPKYHARP